MENILEDCLALFNQVRIVWARPRAGWTGGSTWHHGEEIPKHSLQSHANKFLDPFLEKTQHTRYGLRFLLSNYYSLCRCFTGKLSEVYSKEIDCRQGLAEIRTRWCKKHKDLDKFGPLECNTGDGTGRPTRQGRIEQWAPSKLYLPSQIFARSG